MKKQQTNDIQTPRSYRSFCDTRLVVDHGGWTTTPRIRGERMSVLLVASSLGLPVVRQRG